jgi:hypothetical protein
MRNGGLRAWIQERNVSIETEYYFWGGTVAVVVCRTGSAASHPEGERI